MKHPIDTDKDMARLIHAMNNNTNAYTNAFDPAPRPHLSVDEIERLAKAGVAIDLKTVDIKAADRPSQDPWADAVLNRWMMNPVSRARSHQTFRAPPRFCGGAHGDKVYIFAVLDGHEPQLLEDDKLLFPSDALMAKIHLLLKLTPEEEHEAMFSSRLFGQPVPSNAAAAAARLLGKAI